MPAEVVLEDRRLPVEDVADRSAPQPHLVAARRRHVGREVELALEPRLHLVRATARDIGRLLAREHPQVIVHRLRPEGAGGLDLALEDEAARDQHHSGRQRWRQRRAPCAPRTCLPSGTGDQQLQPPAQPSGGDMARGARQELVEERVGRVSPRMFVAHGCSFVA